MDLPELTKECRAGISADVANLLRRVDAEIAAFKPRCDASGRCCHFEQYGHRLYLTLAELIHFSDTLSAQAAALATTDLPPASQAGIALPQFFARAQPSGCPYQVHNLCHARAARPLGCRIYFCDPDAQSWQNMLYERYHAELKSIHERWHVEYRYMEWRAGLASALKSGWLPEKL